MRRIKVVGFAVMAVLALSAFVSATASAALVGVLGTGAETESFTGSGGSTTLEALSGVSPVICKTQTSEGKNESKTAGSFHITFEGCTAGGITCTGLGDTSGKALALGSFHYVFDKLGTGSELGVGILFLFAPIHLSCSILLVELTGQLLCLITPKETSSTHAEIKCEKVTGGDPKETVYWTEAGTEVKMGNNLLLTSENHGAGKGTGEETSLLILTAKNAMTIMG